mmetsp:Transcript_11004/g.23329  ORF Transcript_11004/g.23329 Transcript_11004/m.23329 type:complete len:818 (-) Transcript_11004:148-2601(-)
MVSIVTATRSCSGLLGTTSSRNYNYKSSTSSIAPIRRRHRLGLSCCCAHNSLLHCLLIISISIAMFVSIAAPARCFCSALTTSSRIVTHSSTTTRSASYSYSSAAFLLRHGGSAAQPVRVLGNLASSRCYSSSSNNRDDSSTSNARRREQDRRNEGRNGSRRSPSSSSSRDRNSPVDRSPVDRSRRRRREIQPREYSSNYNSEYDYTASDNYDDNNTARRRITTTRYDDYDYGNNNNGRNRNNDGYITNNRNNNAGNNPQEKGRNRYSSDGRKKERSLRGRESGRGGRGRGRGRGNSNNNNSSSSRYNQQQRRGSYSESESLERPPTPPLTSRPTYFTCRHTYESALRQELQRSIAAHADAQAAPGFNNDYVDYSKLVSFSKPHPGLVLISTDDKDSIGIASLLSTLRPTYALQVLSNCVVVQAESIKGLAKAILASPVLSQQQDAGLLRNELIAAPRGSLAVHALVPEMGRGMPESNLPQYRRATKVAEEVAAQLQKRCKAARSVNANDTNNEHDTTKTEQEQEKWLLQIMLLEPQIVAASFSKCISSGSNSGSSSSSSSSDQSSSCSLSRPHWTWPNWNLPVGLALVEIDDDKNNNSLATVPSSAYRKLLEAFWYMGERPLPCSSLDEVPPVIDLGACPGGWTGALRRMGCNVIAVDRSPLDKGLMKDSGVDYVGGDAFRFVPPWARHGNDNHNDNHWPGRTLQEPLPNTWMVSDIIAYPDKITELLDDWCGRNWVSHAVVTIKFQSEVPWDDVERATAIVEGHGYSCRTVHFFNNKNEVTFLAVKDGYNRSNSDSTILLGKPMYSPVLPKPKKK